MATLTAIDRMDFGQYMVHKGLGFEAYDLIASLATVQYWRVVLPPDRAVFLQARTLGGDAGPIFYSIYPDAVVGTVGQSMVIENRRIGGINSNVQINRVTLSGAAGTEIVKLIARGQAGGQGIRQAGSTGPGPLQVYMPGGTIVVGVRVLDTVTNVELRYEWVEGDPLEGLNG